MEATRKPIGLLLPALFLTALLAVYGVAMAILRSSYFALHPNPLSMAITFDLTISVSILFYLIIVRPARLSPMLVAPVFLTSLFTASLVLPRAHQGYLSLGHYLAAFVELYLIYAVVQKVRRSPDKSFDAILRQFFGSGAIYRIVRMEVDIWRYGFLFWRERPESVSPTQAVFSYKTVGSWSTLVGLLLTLGTIEAAVVHVLVHQWSAVGAWVLTVLSVYGSLFLWADLQATRLRPFVLTEDTLHIRVGLRWEVDVDLRQVGRVHSVGPKGYTPLKEDLAVTLGDAQFLITLKDPAIATGPFGIRRRFQRLGLSVDEPTVFLPALLERLKALNPPGID